MESSVREKQLLTEGGPAVCFHGVRPLSCLFILQYCCTSSGLGKAKKFVQLFSADKFKSGL